jgi:mannosyltransferase
VRHDGSHNLPHLARVLDEPATCGITGVTMLDDIDGAVAADQTGTPLLQRGWVLGALLTVAAIALWVPPIDVDLWLDEALTIGIAEQPPADLVDALRADGSPPLYYVTLSAWAAVVGWSLPALRALSVVFALGSVVGGAALAWRRFGSHVGIATGVLGTVAPGIAYFATEVRPYALLMLVSLAATHLLLRAIDRPSTRAQLALAAALTAACYTHHWGLFLTIGSLASLLVTTGGPITARLRPVVVTASGVVALYAPWLFVSVEQGSATGAPWLAPPTDLRLVINELSGITGAQLATVLVVLALVLGVTRGRPREFDTLGVQVVATIAAGWLFSVAVTPAFTERYLVAVAPSVTLMLAIAGVHDRRARVAVVLLASLGLVATVRDVTFADDLVKSRAAPVASVVDSIADDSDRLLVVAPDTALPAVHHYLDTRTTSDAPLFLTFQGVTDDPSLVDWRDVTATIRSWDPGAELDDVLTQVDTVVLLDDGPRYAGLAETPYWTERAAAQVRAREALDSHPSVELLDHLTIGEWTARVYSVVPPAERTDTTVG